MSVTLMARVFEANFRDPIKKLVMVALADCAGDDGSNVFPSVATIARKTDLSERTIQRTIKELVASGCLKHDGYWRTPNGAINRYQIVADQLPTRERESSDDTPSQVTDSREGVTDSHPTGDRESPDDTPSLVTDSREGVTDSHPTGDRQSRRGDSVSPNPSLTIRGTVMNREREPADAGAPSPDISPKKVSFSESSPANSPQVKMAATMGKRLTPAAMQVIHEKCTDLNRLQAVIDVCRLGDWSVPTLLSIYEEWPASRHNPEVKRASAAGAPKRNQAGAGNRSTGRNTFRREQCPPRNGVQSEIDACRRNAKNARDRGDLAKAERWETEADKLAAQGAQA